MRALLVFVMVSVFFISNVFGDNSLRIRVADGVLKWKTVWSSKVRRSDRTIENGKTRWYICGNKVEKERDSAYDLSGRILNEIERGYNEHGVRINVWGFLATLANESAFDTCAVDFQTRNILYALKLLKRPRTHITHDKKKIVHALKSKKLSRWVLNQSKYSRRKVYVDLGLSQMRRNVLKLNVDEIASILTVDRGLRDAVDEMIRRSKVYTHKKRPYPRPWRLWPGKRPGHPLSKKYDKKLTKIGWFLGATRKELPLLN